MATGDIGVVTLAKGAEHLSVPSKTYYMMAIGSVVLAIASESSELGQLINKHNIGFVINPDNPKIVAETLMALKKDKQKVRILKDNSLKTSKLFTPKNANIYVEKMKD
jgi:hypothetical protein